MLKITILLERLTLEWLGIGDNKFDKFCIGGSEKIAKKSRKLKNQNLFKSRNLKGEKLSKSWKLAKSKKKLSKSGNLSNFGITKTRPKFLIFNAKTAFNCLWLLFIKALIFQ